MAILYFNMIFEVQLLIILLQLIEADSGLK